ncbi:TPA: DNA adenine methylase [Klebsiella pneumoniae]|uniref:DNA methylase n=1 Tax=Klebsiella pneumoniae TaxID=573 RepID=A0A9Q5ZTL5_KLEPN|nr:MULTISPECIES: DNA adenine methylase [Klebsiella]EIW9022165.1 DNA adenine methylase [Klebsiella pneumoniae]EJK9123682.1 DNA adenine methylase [Klebsiella pneumoniae]EKT3996586.1 DNA adenine methylase [Klebsiella pneumoniae]EKV9631160.1 DNA adenine methylase [Klebsiella pneumoniae]EKV9744290.1 DNA adenine methylase [Klebsiella pneumoniae]
MSYLGSKAASGVYQKIIAEMPPHDTYIETHLGGGAVMLRKPPARHNWGIDIDPETVEAFNQGNPDFLDSLTDNLFIEVGDAVTFLERFDFSSSGRILIYADPPYLHETRSSSARYRHEYSVEDHERLLMRLRDLPDNVSVILSGYPSDLYDHQLASWRSKEFQAMTRGGVRTEKIWMNYPEGRAYSHAFAGKDYNDRYRIKRKAQRWKDKFSNLPVAERLAIMQALCETDVD